MKEEINFVFFGTPDFAVTILDELKNGGYLPKLIVTALDKPKGRGLKLSPPPVKIWAEKNSIPLLQPAKLDSEFVHKLSTSDYQLFIVAAYGKIIPKNILDIPKYGNLNVHPSLLPKFRGPSPIESAILSGEEETGVSVMLLDEEMDHGNIVKREKLKVESNETAPQLEKRLAHLGGKLLVGIISDWISGEIKSIPQNHEGATFTKKIEKGDGLLQLDAKASENWRKYRAFCGWPGTYFFTEKKGKKIRVIVKDADFQNEKFNIKKVLPEGGREMAYDEFLRGL